MFSGEERLLECFKNPQESSTEDIVKNIKNSVDTFVQNNDQFDDITLLCFRYLGGE